jgi:hypothetical protein
MKYIAISVGLIIALNTSFAQIERQVIPDSVIQIILRLCPPYGTKLDPCIFSNTVLKGIPYPREKIETVVIPPARKYHKRWDHWLWPWPKHSTYMKGRFYRKSRRQYIRFFKAHKC